MRTLPSNCLGYLARVALVLAVLAGHLCLAEDIKKIHPEGYVTDLAGVIDAGTGTRLETLCTELEQKTGAQMAIITVRSLEGETASQYANELFKQLGIGAKKDDRGVLLLIAPNDRKYWTEVGYGLEPVINDARAGDAGRAMVPLLRQGNYGGAIEAAAWMLAKYIADDRGVTLSGHPPVRTSRDTNDPPGISLLLALFVGLLILISLFSRFSGRGGGPAGGIGWLIASILLSGGNRGRGWGGGGGWGGSSGGGGWGGFGGGSSGGGGAGGSW